MDRASSNIDNIGNRSHALLWGGLVFILAVVLRLVNLHYLSLNDPAFFSPQIDSLWHHRWAIEIIRDSFWGEEVYFRAPLYPYLLAAIYWIFGLSVTVAKIIQALGGGAICVLVYLLGRWTFGEREGRIASLFAVFYGTMILYESELLIVWLAVLLDLWMIYLAVKWRERWDWRAWLAVGIIGGLSSIARPNVLLVFPLLFFWLYFRKDEQRPKGFFRRIVPSLALTVGVVICVLPVTVRNYIVGDEVVLIASQGGVNLHLSNNEQADGLTMIMPEVKLDYTLPWSEFVDTTHVLAEAETGRDMTYGEVSSYYASKALDYITSQPFDFLALTGKRIIYFFSGFENSDQADIYRFKENSPILNALIFDRGVYFPFGVIAPLALLGIVLGWRRRRKLIPVYLFLIGYIPTVVLFLVTARHRLPVVAMLLPFAAYALGRLIEVIKETDWKRLVVMTVPLVILMALLNQTFFDLGYETPGQFHYQRGIVLQRQGLFEQAIGEYRRALDHQVMPEAHNNMGFAHAQLGEFTEAYQEYHRALSLKPAYADPMINLGRLFLGMSQLDSAEYYLQLAREISPSLPQIYINLANLNRQRGDIVAAERTYLAGLEVAPNSAPLNNNLGTLYLQMQRKIAARQFFEKALEADRDYPEANVNLANMYIEEGRRDEAIALYRRAIESDPGLMEAYLNLAGLLIQEKEFEEARGVLRDAPPNEHVEKLKQQLGME